MSENRIEAFAAIRRAVALARLHDKQAARYQQAIIHNVESRKFLNEDYLADVESDAQNIWNHQSCAEAIRQAIRAAIELEKT